MKFHFALLFLLVALLAAIYAQSDESESFLNAANEVDGSASEVYVDAEEEQEVNVIEEPAISNEAPAVFQEEVSEPEEEIIDTPITPEPIKLVPVVADPPVEPFKKVDTPPKDEAKTEIPTKKEASTKVSTSGQQSAIAKFFASFFGFFAKFFGS